MAPLKSFSELSMKTDKKLPNLKEPVKGKKGTSKFMRMKIHSAPYSSDYKKAMNSSVQSADRKPEKYMKPDGKVGVRMVKTDKEVIKKETIVDPRDLRGRPKKADPNPESKYGIKHPLHPANLAKKKTKKTNEAMQVFRVGHKTMGGNVHAKDHDSAMAQLRKKGVKGDITLTHRGPASSMPKPKNIRRESIDNHPKVKAARKAHAAGTWDGNVDKEGEAVVHINGKPHTVTNRYGPKKQSNPSRFKPFKKKNEAMDLDQMMRMRFQASASQKKNQKQRDDKEKKRMAAKADVDMRARKVREAVEYPHMMYDPKTGNEVKAKTPADHEKYTKMGYTHEKPKMDEALNLQQRMKRSRLMKRMKSRIAIGRKRAMKKMANKKTIEKRAMRQARNDLAKKLTRGIPKKDLTFARKQEIEKRLAKPALQSRIKRMARKLFKDVRKKELQRKKG